MRFSTRMLLLAVAALFSPAAPAQTAEVTTLRQPVTYQQTAYEYESYYAEDGQAPAPEGSAPAAAAAPAAPAGGCAPACGACAPACGTCAPSCCQNGCGSCCEEEEEASEPCRLFDCCFLSSRSMSLTGWVAQSFTWNPDNPDNRMNGPVTFNDRSNEYQLNQLYLVGQRAIDTSDGGFDIGGRIDLLYGTDWRFTPALGLELETDGTRKWNQDHRFYGLAMPQAYAEVGLGDLSVKLGHFYTIIGYEVVTAPDNFFISHAYTMQYGEPFTHTGALGRYALNDNWAVSAGITRGWDNWEDNNDSEGFLGGITWTSDDANSSLAWACTVSDEDLDNDESRYMQSVVATQGLTDNLKYVFQTDFGHQNGANGNSDQEWYGVNQYLFYTLSDTWTAGGRCEWFRDDDGTRVFADGFAPPLPPIGGFAGNFWEWAIGLNWKPTANFTARSECRWDQYDGPSNAAFQLPYDDGQDSNQFLWGNDIIFLY